MTEAPIFDLDWTTQQQLRASDPKASAWVSANAGSGKTHVLSQRVIRLLLEGAKPSAILCLTYTKAAASEMSNRVFARLAQWATQPDDRLFADLSGLDGQLPSPARLAFARQLFARALETPGGLKIQTIHAFCEAVLHQFPLEANVAGHFTVMDDGQSASLIAEARRSLLTATGTEDDISLAHAFATVLGDAGEAGLETLLDDLVAQRGPVQRFLETSGGAEGARQIVSTALGLDPAEDEGSIKASVWPIPTLPPHIIAAYADAASAASAKKARSYADALQAAAGADTVEERWRHLAGLFLRADGKTRSLSQAGAGKIDATLPDIQDRIAAATTHFEEALDRLARWRMTRATGAALTLARRLLGDYERLKRLRGNLDFEDLVERTASLLARGGASAWVHYKLDQGIDHVLVDEAQDTSPAQWQIIRQLADEFFAGDQAGRRRTLFSVGDEKQSIYSFQGARPERFRQEGRSVESAASASETRFEGVELKLSFRSTSDVLKAVDRVFEDAEARRGLGEPGGDIIHESVRGREPGLVDVWEMIAKEKRVDEEDWTAPFDDTPEHDPKTRLAKRIAGTIRQWIGDGHRVVKGRSVPITAGDILVLVRKRDGFVNALMRELKHHPAIPVAGADRLVLTDHIAVKDLMALGRVLSLPDDDLSLASLLKSPLFELDEDQLFTLCHGREPTSGVEAELTRLAEAGEQPFMDAKRKLDRYAVVAAESSVHDFYAHVLGPLGGRADFLARLGNEAADVLDEFLAFALDHEAAGLPGMQSFLAVLDQQSPTIKRELEQDRDEVRIMTVHASKGLEAPVVFLVDSGGEAARGQNVSRLRSLDISGMECPVPLWVPSRAHENSVSLDLKNRMMRAAEEEYRRLLYVGMTRAADRLVVCGYHGLNPPRGPHWLSMVRTALERGDAEPTTFQAGGMTWDGFRFSRAKATPTPTDGAPAPAAPVDRVDIPTAPLPPPERPPRPLTPSGTHAVIDDEVQSGPIRSPFAGAAAGDDGALVRGRIIHRFLQILPDLAATDRSASALRYLERAAPHWPSQTREELVASVMTIIETPGFATVFAPGSEAEVAIMGTVRLGDREHVVSGRIDRLAVGPDRVRIIDYKTNRPPARSLADVPAVHTAQLALYRELLRPLYPDRQIEAALLFTEAPVLIEVPPAALDGALAALTTK
ncbi:double-strand break repair helicase AddA [Pararhizobium haloflavum]|uniref:double-strand break repair helicase AddA n=1 Tax=Pararhizobium haloflavum TaxID=2037914 RepID=UPI000C192258|nr:double-strand break repair helicase AddA [Pararhizobium haloflavum]